MHFRDESWDEAIQSTWDEAIFDCVANKNEYGLLNLDAMAILDIGAHIGSFAHIAKMKGARVVHCYEANPQNYDLLKENTRDLQGVRAFYGAVWRSDVEIPQLFYQPSTNKSNTGGGNVLSQTGIPVPTKRFDEIVSQFDVVNLLKLDAEGSEFPILLTSRELGRIDEIVGEYHEIYDVPAHLRVENQPEFTASALVRFLERSGFEAVSEHVAENLGKFHAWRPGIRLLSNLLVEDVPIE